MRAGGLQAMVISGAKVLADQTVAPPPRNRRVEPRQILRFVFLLVFLVLGFGIPYFVPQSDARRKTRGKHEISQNSELSLAQLRGLNRSLRKNRCFRVFFRVSPRVWISWLTTTFEPATHPSVWIAAEIEWRAAAPGPRRSDKRSTTSRAAQHCSAAPCCAVTLCTSYGF